MDGLPLKPHPFLPSAYSHRAKIRLCGLQILKFIYKQDRLNFTEDLVVDDRDCMISEPQTPKAVDKLVVVGNFRKLDDMLANARELDYD